MGDGMEKVGLVLQGGGMRGIYTSGVLDFFMERQLFFSYVSAVSAGACNGAVYLARQKGLGRTTITKFIQERRFFHLGNLLRKQTLLGIDFIFDEILSKLAPFDYDRFHQSTEHFVVATTDCLTGESVYYSKSQCDDIFLAIRASCSLPFVSRQVKIGERFLLDGSIADPIPLKKSIEDGNERHVIVLTAPASTPSARFFWNVSRLYDSVYPRASGIRKALSRHLDTFYESLGVVEKLRAENRAFVISPTESCISSFERNHGRLQQFYERGYEDARACYPHLMDWLEQSERQKNVSTSSLRT
ncbi:patatin family protein [Brevibacillus ruminantium]|uniref:Patatin family protein n=1 Tax=Brevibacillus ruminantium TaxID=2950604 RepID=A0ABY4WD75_9BACL|nr:patatin family protein [Brevibacillus ruminantium]USG65013.1 patatin family protein [Brevibacillus ruminantium]